MFARFERGNGDGRMHVGRSADPDDIEIGNGEEIGPVRHRRGLRHILPTKFFRAFVGRIGDGDDLHFGMRFERGQMPCPHDVAGADDADSQFVIIRAAMLNAVERQN